MLERILGATMRGIAIDRDAKRYGQRWMHEEVVPAVGVPHQTGAFVLCEGNGGSVVGSVGYQASCCCWPELSDEAVVGGLAADGFFKLGDEDFLPVFGVMFEFLVGFAGGGAAWGGGRGGIVAVRDGRGARAFEGLVGIVAGEGDVG